MEELAETGLESDDSVGVIDGVGVSRCSLSVLGGGSSTDGVDFDDFWVFQVYEVVAAVVDDLLGCTEIGSSPNFYQINEVSSAESTSVVDCDGNSNEKDPFVVCFGDMLIDFVATVGGVPVAEAHMLPDILRRNNVGNSGVCFDTKARTAMAFATDGEHGFTFFRDPSADMLLRESELNEDLLDKASFFLYGSLSLSEEMCRSTQLAALKAGCILSYDPTLRLALWQSPEDAKIKVMSIWDWDQEDTIKISEGEILFSTDGASPYEDNVVSKKLLYSDIKFLLVTEGSEGCRYYTQEFKGKVGGVKVNCIDTTGAGDAFVSELLELDRFCADRSLYKDKKSSFCLQMPVEHSGSKKYAQFLRCTKEAVNQVLLKVET